MASKLAFLRFAKGANYKGFFEKIKALSEKTGRNSVLLTAHYLYCFLTQGFGLSDYFDYRIYDRTRAERKKYASIKDEDYFYNTVNPEEYKTFFTIKFNFLENFKQYIPREYIIPTEDNLEEFKAFCERNPRIMVKPYDGLGGKDVHRVVVEEEGGAEKLHARLVEEKLFAEEVIKQHEDMSRFGPNSINTIRVMTFNANGKRAIFYAGLRCGSGREVDNMHSGGIGCNIDLKTGKLKGIGRNKDAVPFECHPITGQKFDGAQIPFWEEVKKMCLDASCVNTKIHVVGWDVAITPDGPTFVEGNRRAGFDLPQVVSDHGCKYMMAPILKEVMAEREKEKNS